MYLQDISHIIHCVSLLSLHQGAAYFYLVALVSIHAYTGPKLNHLCRHIMMLGHQQTRYWLIYFVWSRYDNMPPCTGSRVNTNYVRFASWGGCWWRTGDPIISETPLAAQCCSQRPNHSAITHLSKTDWHHLSGITHFLQQQVNSEQERFSTELLIPGTGVEILFCMEETW